MNSDHKKGRGKTLFPSFDFLVEKAIIILLVAVFLLFILYPVFGVLMRSFSEGGALTLEHYRVLFTPRNLELIRNSVFVATLSSVIATFLAFSIGLFSFFKSERIRAMLYRGLMMTMISPPFISAIALITLFGRRGLISHGLFGASFNPYGWHGIVLLQSLSGVSLSAIMMITGLSLIDSRLIQASRDLGANPQQTLHKIILPSMVPTILSVLFLQFTMNISDFTTPIIIGGRFHVLATEAYLRVYAQANLGSAASMTVLLLPPAIIAFYFYQKNLKRVNTLSERAKIIQIKALNFKLPPTVHLITGAITVIFFSFMIIKYGNIFLTSVVTRTVTGSMEFTLDHIAVFQSRHMDALIRTLYMAIIAGLLSTVSGMLLSYYNQRRRIPGMKTVEFVASLPYIIPGIFFGLGYIVAFHSGPIALTGTLLILILNCTFRHVSVGNKAANAAFENLDRKLEWASNDLGASKTLTLFTVVFPMLRSTFLLSYINTFTACMTTVGPLILLVTPGNLITSVLMFNEINSGRYGQGAVLGSVLILITVSANLVAIYLLSREKRKEL